MSRDILEITLKPEIREFLNQAQIARLATCDTERLQPHVVPVWYEWDGNFVWISSFRSTRKVKEIKQNPLVSLVVDTDSRGEAAHAVLFEGRVELIDDPEIGQKRGFSIYSKYLGEDGAKAKEPQSWLHDPEHLLIKITPQKVYAWGFS